MENQSRRETGHNSIVFENGNDESESVMQPNETWHLPYPSSIAWHLEWVYQEPSEKPQPWSIEKPY
jgi:hypothetical protein